MAVLIVLTFNHHGLNVENDNCGAFFLEACDDA